MISKKKKKGFRRNHKFSDQMQVISKKKRSSLKSEGFFWPKSQILTFFPPKNSNFFLPKKYRGGARKKSGGKKENRGGKNENRGGKNENRGGIAPLPPRWRRACVCGFEQQMLKQYNRKNE